jgi:hypothetical protein
MGEVNKNAAGPFPEYMLTISPNAYRRVFKRDAAVWTAERRRAFLDWRRRRKNCEYKRAQRKRERERVCQD